MESAQLLDLYTSKLLREMTHTVVDGLAEKYPKIRKGVNTVVGGNILVTESTRIWQRGIREGLRKGRLEGRQEGIIEGRTMGRKEGIIEGKEIDLRNLMETLQLTLEQAMNALKIPQEERGNLIKMMDS